MIVNCVEWGPSELGLILACCSSDGCVTVISLVDDAWKEVKFEAHKQPINSLSWAPFKSSRVGRSLNTFCTASCDKTIVVWDFDKGANTYKRFETVKDEFEQDKPYNKVEEIRAHSDVVRSVAWNPSPLLNSDLIVSCSEVNFPLKNLRTKRSNFSKVTSMGGTSKRWLSLLMILLFGM